MNKKKVPNKGPRSSTRQNDPLGFGMEHLYKSDPLPCFECAAVTKGRHHVVPVSDGGTKVIPLCGDCHNKVHGAKISHSEVIKRALAKRKAQGLPIGAKPKLTQKKVERIVSWREKGKSYKYIAAKVGLSVGTVYRVCRDNLP